MGAAPEWQVIKVRVISANTFHVIITKINREMHSCHCCHCIQRHLGFGPNVTNFNERSLKPLQTCNCKAHCIDKCFGVVILKNYQGMLHFSLSQML